MARNQPTGHDLIDFLNQQVLPALFERLDQAFPEFCWQRTPKGWVATNREHTKSLLGARPNRVVCLQPWGFYVYGDKPTSWTAYVSGGNTPRGQDFVEAVQKLAALAGVDASLVHRELTDEDQMAIHQAERRTEILEAFLSCAQAALREDAAGPAGAYLATRGFAEDDLEAIGFGFYTTQAQVSSALSDAGFTPQEIADSGLLADARWEDRLVGPWRDRWGRIGTIYARDVSGAVEQGAKYLYLRGTKKTDLVALGLDSALRVDEGLRNLVIVEGLFDAISLQALGIGNVAAIGGGGGELSPKRWAALSSFGVRSATLLLDNDEAGVSGTLTAIENANRADHAPTVYVVAPTLLGDAKDPDAYVRGQGSEALQALLETRQPANAFYASRLLEDTSPDSPIHDQREAVEQVLGFIASLREQAVLDAEDILHLTAERTTYSLAALRDLAAQYRKVTAKQDLDGALKRAQMALASTSAASVGQVASALRASLDGLLQANLEAPRPFSVARLDRESQETSVGLQSGWRTLDLLDVRFIPGELSLLAARTGHAKTSALIGLLLNWLQSAPSNSSAPLMVLYSFEEPEVRVYHRLLSLLTLQAGHGLTVGEIRNRLQCSDKAWSAFEEAASKSLEDAKGVLQAAEDRLLIVSRPDWTIDDVVAHARSMTRTRPIGAILVDYLQRVPPPRRSFDRRDIEVSAIARGLKSLAMEIDIPVITGAQINREAVAGAPRIPDDKPYDDPEVQRAIRARRPKLHHLREGGSEQEADLVLGLLSYRADFEEDLEDQIRPNTGSVPEVTRIDIGILKNRYGAPGRWAALNFHGRFGLIHDAKEG